jgi:hypothetical protein
MRFSLNIGLATSLLTFGFISAISLAQSSNSAIREIPADTPTGNAEIRLLVQNSRDSLVVGQDIVCLISLINNSPIRSISHTSLRISISPLFRLNQLEMTDNPQELASKKTAALKLTMEAVLSGSDIPLEIEATTGAGCQLIPYRAQSNVRVTEKNILLNQASYVFHEYLGYVISIFAGIIIMIINTSAKTTVKNWSQARQLHSNLVMFDSLLDRASSPETKPIKTAELRGLLNRLAYWYENDARDSWFEECISQRDGQLYQICELARRLLRFGALDQRDEVRCSELELLVELRHHTKLLTKISNEISWNRFFLGELRYSLIFWKKYNISR